MNKGRGSRKGEARQERGGVDMPVGLLPRFSLSGVVLEGGKSPKKSGPVDLIIPLLGISILIRRKHHPGGE